MKTERHKRASIVIAATRRHMIAVVSKAVTAGEAVAKRLCPVDKGDLISTTFKEDDHAGHAKLGTGGPSKISDRYVNHHIYQEWGTSKMPAQSFYRPGVEAAKDVMRREMPRK